MCGSFQEVNRKPDEPGESRLHGSRLSSAIRDESHLGFA